MEAYLSAAHGHKNPAAAGDQSRKYWPQDCGIAIDEENPGNHVRGDGSDIHPERLVPGVAAPSAMHYKDEGMAAALTMTPRTRAVLVLRFVHGLSSREIARHFGLSQWMVRRHLRLAVRAIGKATEP